MLNDVIGHIVNPLFYKQIENFHQPYDFLIIPYFKMQPFISLFIKVYNSQM